MIIHTLLFLAVAGFTIFIWYATLDFFIMAVKELLDREFFDSLFTFYGVFLLSILSLILGAVWYQCIMEFFK